jgi:hypothetical protein
MSSRIKLLSGFCAIAVVCLTYLAISVSGTVYDIVIIWVPPVITNDRCILSDYLRTMSHPIDIVLPIMHCRHAYDAIVILKVV